MKQITRTAFFILLSSVVTACMFSIGQDERGVFTDSTGQIHVLGPGAYQLTLDTAFTEIYSIADQTYTISGISNGVDLVETSNAVETHSADDQILYIEGELVYRIRADAVAQLAIRFKSDQIKSEIIRPVARGTIDKVAQTFSSQRLLSESRVTAATEIRQQIAEQIRPLGIEVIGFKIRNVLKPD